MEDNNENNNGQNFNTANENVNGTNNGAEVNDGNQIKREAADAFNQAKQNMKNINFKEEAENSKNLLIDLFKRPTEVIENIVKNSNDSIFKTSIVLVIAWLVIILIDMIIYYTRLKYTDFNFLVTLKRMLAPVCGILVSVGAIAVLNKENKKPITNVVSAVVTANIPLIIAQVVGMLTYIHSNASYIVTPVNSLLRVISLALEFVAIKNIFEKDDQGNFISFVEYKGIFYIAYFILVFLGIYI